MSIGYNLLNLPSSISRNSESISYIYSAAGEKLAKRMKDNNYNYYAGSMVYNSDKSLKYILFEEGLVNKSSGAFTYEYHLKDHLGNTRVAFQPNGGGATTTQVAEYYPFGSSYLPVSPAGTNKYLYNGKEKQDDVLGGTALDEYDYGARFYDARIGRWQVIDGKAEKYSSVSQYIYALNNPIKFVDPDGNDVFLVIWGTDNGRIGHAGIAVSNYKEYSEKVNIGGKWTNQTKMIPDGTYTYRDLWPGEGVGKSNFDDNVNAVYNEKTVTIDDLINKDISGSEGYAPDGVIQLKTDKLTDDFVNIALESAQSNGSFYNGLKNNCTDFAKQGVLFATPSGESLNNATEKIGKNNVTTPNQLYKATKELSNSKIIKDAGVKVNNTFIEGISNKNKKRREYAEDKMED